MKLLMDSFEKMTGKLEKNAEKLDSLNITTMKRTPYTRNVKPQNSIEIRNRQTRSCYVCGRTNHLARENHKSPSTYWFKIKQTPFVEGKVVNYGKGNTSDKSSSEKDNEESKLKVKNN